MAGQKSSARLRLEEEKDRLVKKGAWNPHLDQMYENELKSIEMQEAREWFKLAEGPGMDAVSLSGLGRSGIGYAPQRDITKTFPGSLSEKEEEERLALRARVGPAPGLFRLA